MSADWTTFPFTYDGVTREVHRTTGDKPRRGILLMHELGGISPETVKFAESLDGVRSPTDGTPLHPGFDVYVPAMFGRFRQTEEGPAGRRLAAIVGTAQMMCVRSEYRAMASKSSSPIAGWMRALSRDIGAQTGHNIGVVGMCLTGGVVFSMVWDPIVEAAVSAQPSLPFLGARTETTVSDEDFAASAATGKNARALHFKDDVICDPDRVEKLREDWQDKGGGSSLVQRTFPGKGHATLTEHHARTVESGGSSSRDWVREFFEGTLR